MAGSVKFYRGSYDVYVKGLEEGKYTDGIFFDENRFTIYLNGQEYGGSADITGAASKEWVIEHYGNAFYDVAQEIDDLTGFTASFIAAYDNSSAGSINIPIAGVNQTGLMSKEDKSKLNSVDPNNFVKKEEGKQLSSNNYTDDEKDKLSNIESNAQINKIEIIKINGVTQDIVEKVVDLDIKSIVDKYINTTISSAYQYKGSVNTAAELPTTNLSNGDVYNIEQASSEYGAAGVNVVWNSDTNSWDSLGGLFSTADLEHNIDIIESDINNLSERIHNIESQNLNNRLTNVESSINTFNDSETTSGSIKYIAKEIAEKVVNNTLTWEVL